MGGEVFLERMTTRLVVPPGVAASALRGRLDRVALGGLGDALAGAAVARLPERSILLVRRLRLRLLVGDGALPEPALAGAWGAAIRSGLDRLAAPVLARRDAPYLSDGLAYFPAPAEGRAAALRALAGAAGGAPWWLEPLLAELAPEARRQGTERRVEALLEASLRDGARPTAELLAVLLEESGGGFARRLSGPFRARLLRRLAVPLAVEAQHRTAAPPESPAAEQAARRALATLWPAAAGWAARAELPVLALAAAVALRLNGEADPPRAEALRRTIAAALAEPRPAGRPAPGDAPRAPAAERAAEPAEPEARAAGARRDTGREHPARPAGAEAGAAPRARAADATATGEAPAPEAQPGQAVELAGLLFLIRPALVWSGTPEGRLPEGAALPEVLRRLGCLAGAPALAAFAEAERPALRRRNAPLLAVLGAQPLREEDDAGAALWTAPERDDPAARWAAGALSQLAERLPDDLAAVSARAGDDPWRRLILRPGRLELSDSHAILHLPMATLDVALRRAGWDIDPGWLPVLGRVVRFRYEQPGTRA